MNRYSLGCAFSMEELFYNFPFEKINFKLKMMRAQFKNSNALYCCAQIFRYCYQLVIDDIVNNNVTFWLPVYGLRECNMHMKKYDGEAFKNLRRAGKWQDIDFLKSYFSAYQITFYMLGKRTPRTKSVYVCKKYRDIITKKTNEGFPYGDGKVDKYIKDYHQAVFDRFPLVSEKDIKRILRYAWRSLYLHNSYGGDTLIVTEDFWSYIGNLRKDPLEHYQYYIKKLSIRIRVMYRKQKKGFQGYYYFALCNKQYEQYISQQKKRGRPRKHFKLDNVLLYMIYDECRVRESGKSHIFRIPYLSYVGYTKFLRHLETDNIEEIVIRKPLKFDNISVYLNKYEDI